MIDAASVCALVALLACWMCRADLTRWWRLEVAALRRWRAERRQLLADLARCQGRIAREANRPQGQETP